MKMSLVKLPNDLCNASMHDIEFCSASIKSSLLWKYKIKLLANWSRIKLHEFSKKCVNYQKESGNNIAKSSG